MAASTTITRSATNDAPSTTLSDGDEMRRARCHDQARVLLQGDCLQIAAATVTDADVLRSASAAQQRHQSLDQWLASTLRLGAIATEAASSGADLQKVQTAIDGLASRIDAAVNASTSSLSQAVSHAVDADTGPLAVASQRAVDRLATGIGRLIHENGDLPRSVRAAVAQVTDQALAEFQRAAASHSETVKLVVGQDRHAVKDAVLVALQTQHADLVATVSELRAAVAQQQAVATAIAANKRRNSADGTVFERDCGTLLCQIAVNAGDGGSIDVSARKGSTNTLKGDHLVLFASLHPSDPPRMVVEVKDRVSKPLSIREWREELEAGRRNRSAVVAMGVTSPHLMPVPGERLIVLDADTLIVGRGPDGDAAGDAVLTAAYLLLRMSAARPRGTDGDLTPELVHRRVEELQAALAPLAQLDRSVSAGRAALDDIEAVARKVRNDTTARLQHMHEELLA